MDEERVEAYLEQLDLNPSDRGGGQPCAQRHLNTELVKDAAENHRCSSGRTGQEPQALPLPQTAG